MKKVLGIINEFEGDGPMYFDLSDPQMLVNYILDNIEKDEVREFIVKDMTDEEFAALE